MLTISTRALVETAGEVIAGFILAGTDDKETLIRALGPSLVNRGVSNALADPVLQLFDANGTLLAQNDNWKDAQQSEIESTGIPPSDDLESAVLITLPSSRYTAVMAGKGGAGGVGMIEVYDLSPLANAQFVNISTRGFVGTGSNVLIGGFILSNGSASAATIVLRAIGPSLSGAGISDALQDPTLELRNVNGVLLAANDNWRDTEEGAIQSTGLAPADDREAAILISLGVGNYAAIVRGKNGTTGMALVEVYNLQ